MQSENPVRTYLDPEHHAWITKKAKQRSCSVAQVLRDLVVQAATESQPPEDCSVISLNHKVLTDEGWKTVSELVEDDLLACANPETGVVELHPASWKLLRQQPWKRFKE